MMQLEYIKPKLKLIEGIPAYNYGEWPGQLPNIIKRGKSIARLQKPNIIFTDSGKSLIVNLQILLSKKSFVLQLVKYHNQYMENKNIDLCIK